MEQFEKQYYELPERARDDFLRRAKRDHQRREYEKFNLITWIIDLITAGLYIGLIFYCLWLLSRLFY